MSLVTPRGFYLGKREPVASPFGEFKTYFADALGAPPSQAHFGYRVKVPWQMDGNGPDPAVTIAPDGWAGCGDCVEAGKAHALTSADYWAGHEHVPVPTANQVVQQYASYQGCTPAELFADPSQYDDGEDVSTSLVGWCNTTEYGVKLAFTAPVNAGSSTDLKNAIAISGGLGIGVQLQQAQEDQFPGMWQWVPGSPDLGGHFVWITGYDDLHVFLVTWGRLIAATWSFVRNAIDEAHAMVMPQSVWYGRSPSGLLIPKWEADLNALKVAA